ncbi:hypothetical protein IGI04_002015 [Brassica rapa subsp. trilocularis]|uniref:Uncharacterized protein n=1 Tax=Brassica rapa subsp. trilocularis TaxID=1813537 RepID=A0ABQ7NUG8_BRACM|nr:hypothetical protein IGI04_002015 [Brassica rapa subsp. trilocularis]
MSSSQGDKKDSDVEMGAATSPAPIPTSPAEVPACVAGHLSFREKLVRRQAEKELAQTGSELPSSSAQVATPCHGIVIAAPLPQVLPAGSSTTPILVEDKEKAADSIPPPPARKEIVLALRAPSAVLATQPKSRKRKLAKSGDGETSQQGGSSLASGLRGKFISLIDGMISECGSETSRLSGELVELQGRWSETEAMLTAVEDSHSAKVSKLEVAIGELERDLGKTASSLLKEKKARKAKSSEVRRLKRQIESDAGLARRGIQEATDALRAEFQARLAKISASLGSLECIRSRDFALATIEGGMAVVRSFQSETPPTLEAEEARLSGCKGDMAAEDGDLDLILADLKSACFLPTCSEDPEGKDPMVGENGSDAAPGSDEAAGEEGAGEEGDELSSYILPQLLNVLFETCFESSSARCELCGGAEGIECKHRGVVYFRFKDCAVTNRLSFFLSRFLPDSYRCKVREKFSAYTTCLIRIEHLSGDRNAIILVSDVRESSSCVHVISIGLGGISFARKKPALRHLLRCLAMLKRQTVGTEIHTVDFRLNKETKKTLVSQRTWISVNYHTSSNQNTRITTIKIRNRKESKVDLIPNLRMSVTTRYKPGLESCRRDSYAKFALKKFPSLCSSPRTPYMLAPRSVYAFTLLPLSRHSIKWRFSIFPVLHNYLQNFRIYPRKLDIYPSSWAKRKPCCGLRAFG